MWVCVCRTLRRVAWQECDTVRDGAAGVERDVPHDGEAEAARPRSALKQQAVRQVPQRKPHRVAVLGLRVGSTASQRCGDAWVLRAYLHGGEGGVALRGGARKVREALEERAQRSLLLHPDDEGVRQKVWRSVMRVL